MTKCMRIKTPHSVLHLLKQNISYKYCDRVNTGLPLTPCAFVCVHVLSYRTEVPGAWGAWGSGVGRCWPLTQNWRKGNKRWLFSSLQLGLRDHWRDLTGGVALPAFDGQSPRLHQLTVGFAYALCTKRLYWINCNTNPIKLKIIWKTCDKH